MKTSTGLGHSFLLVVVLAVSWAAAAPAPDQRSEQELREFLNSRPFTPYPFSFPPRSHHYNHYPYNSFPSYHASRHVAVVDPYSVVSFLVNNERWADQNDSDESDEDDHERRKRQATFDFGMHRGPYGRDYHASAGYNRNFNSGRTSVGVNAHRNWGSGGKSHGFGISFSHKFRR
ncbi:uncharacterized protein LOC126997347 [Eriocheir sinensis]|uniref:uncharacterized protein LOC126997347 n=1 Tax=Eriocheir sinensis TaxID=95602 RepID=UPI0021C7C983|nr:uncharacterized protein LOC126997347 [Eriocheir sinensis]